ncbi:hypothetical protein MHL39_10765 [Roseomonas mucosa]|uniref:hypothetical protein n=1 Tax=Roseomonas mucosa TaxID=207340 RepID=UPI001EF7337C|nr:hypothetical protein [Roseomonas mucosa]MCG7357120.1 hypothetical protein [Roseomonas mucosa]
MIRAAAPLLVAAAFLAAERPAPREEALLAWEMRRAIEAIGEAEAAGCAVSPIQLTGSKRKAPPPVLTPPEDDPCPIWSGPWEGERLRPVRKGRV